VALQLRGLCYDRLVESVREKAQHHLVKTIADAMQGYGGIMASLKLVPKDQLLAYAPHIRAAARPYAQTMTQLLREHTQWTELGVADPMSESVASGAGMLRDCLVLLSLCEDPGPVLDTCPAPGDLAALLGLGQFAPAG
jgi:hypothetical protein